MAKPSKGVREQDKGRGRGQAGRARQAHGQIHVPQPTKPLRQPPRGLGPTGRAYWKAAAIDPVAQLWTDAQWKLLQRAAKLADADEVENSNRILTIERSLLLTLNARLEKNIRVIDQVPEPKPAPQSAKTAAPADELADARAKRRANRE